MTGILYLVATPIGNLEDITFRAVRILREVDVIAAEDTRHTRKLLAHFEIHKPLIRYDEYTDADKALKLLLEGKNIACVSDAGLPAISDPGANLVKAAVENNITVCPIPGANAALSALICSALDSTKFTFAGFLPKSAKNRREILTELSTHKETLIFYEAPHRIKKIVEELCDTYGGDIVAADGATIKSFPKVDDLCKISAFELSRFSLGYRSAYIHDALQRVKGLSVALDDLYSSNDDDLMDTLKTIKGVGDKIAACVGLYAYHRFACVPIDVWIKRAIQDDFKGENVFVQFGSLAGVLQQYIYYYKRFGTKEIL